MGIDNISFVGRPHYCKKCNKQIDPIKIVRLVAEALNPKLYSKDFKIDPADPVVIEEFGNDVSLSCSLQCFKDYLMNN
jgi:hypothetical protein